jgi:phosphatidate cytidylyltransferase
MNLKRILTGVIGLPIVALILIFGNIYLIDIIFSIVAIIAIHEYFNAFSKKHKPVKWIGYLMCVIIAFLHVIPMQYLLYILPISLFCIIATLFLSVIISNMKITVTDIIITFFGICYITLFLSFIPLLYGIENGKYLIWFILIAAWGTDTSAYFVGCKFGKHKFTQVSPKKSIEGCIGGIAGAVIIALIYAFFLNKYVNIGISYIGIAPIVALLSALSQIGDLSASTIKRSVEIKDFGNIFPGHGGMLDRIDSIIFIAPFAYFLLMLI